MNKRDKTFFKNSEEKLEFFWNDIPTEKEKAVTYDQLTMWWNADTREVRKILHDLSAYDNGDNYVLIRSGKSKGFYKTDDKAEIEAFKRECLNKGRSVFAPVKKINRILTANANQYTITNNLRVIREERQLKQSTVCNFMQAFDEAFDVSMLSKMENGRCLPTPFQLAKLSEIYGCPPSDLVNADLYF